ncbi:acyl-ACP thioesterase domain-containing protein [Gordonia sp. CPCC 205333]|uniref:acyl-ACP thioesterase domain-containing protein n=1 Tax=Gordonia sp. CPCC 205333 TaxID=3140790 RepID=UPI003AF375F8
MIGEPLPRRISDPQRRRELLDSGAIFTAQRTVRGDAVSQDHRLKFDGVARYLQDAGQDHLLHIRHDEIHPHWVVRRTVIEILAGGEQPDVLDIERWGSKIGSRWCNVRIDLDGHRGTRVETEAFWINFNVETVTPSALSDSFVNTVGSAAEPGVLRWKKWLDPAPHVDAFEVPFLLRAADLDIIQHVNNAVYWTALEEVLATQPDLRERLPMRGVVEHNSPLQIEDAPQLLAYRAGQTLYAWLVAGDRTAAAMSVESLP